MKDSKFIIIVQKILNQPVKDEIKTLGHMSKIATSQGNDYTTGCLLPYSYFKDNCKLIVRDWRKQQTLDADPKVSQQISCTENLERTGNTGMFFILHEFQRNLNLRFLTKNCKSIADQFYYFI